MEAEGAFETAGTHLSNYMVSHLRIPYLDTHRRENLKYHLRSWFLDDASNRNVISVESNKYN
jgi:hypothetical protein